MLLVVPVVLGCAAEPEATETVDQAATGPNTWIWTNHVRWRANGLTEQRFVRIECGQTCTQSVREPTGRWNPKTGEEIYQSRCVQWAKDCDRNIRGASLFPTKERAEDGTKPYDATDAYSGSVSEYRGCGPQAAMNFANYTGMPARIEDAARLTNTWHIRWAIPGWAQDWLPEQWMKIASTPGQLREGLQWTANDARHHYRPTVRNGVHIRTALDHLKRGYPVVVLVNGGFHWQVLTGYRIHPELDEVYVIDYVDRGNHGWRPTNALRYDNLRALPSALLGFDGYEDSTMITFDPIVYP